MNTTSRIPSSLTLTICLPLVLAAQEAPLDEIAASPGLAVHLGTTDGQLEIDLAGRGFRCVHGLALEAASGEESRKAIAAEGLYGHVSVETVGSLQTLPYAENLVNFVVADLDALKDKAPPREEIDRILAPRGMALLKHEGRWMRSIKPRPEGMDEWTHPFYGPDESRSSADRRVGVPAGLQWVAGPIFTAAHRKSSTESAVSAGGRIFYMTQNEVVNFEAEPKKRPNFLVARDAFNGLFLWRRSSRGRHIGRSGRVNPRLVAAGPHLYVQEEGEIVALDAATGRRRLTYATGSTPEKFLLRDGVLVVETKKGIVAFSAETAERKWEHEPSDDPRETVAGGSTVCFFENVRDEGRFLTALDLDTGARRWRKRVQEGNVVSVSSRLLRIAFLDSERIGLVGREVFLTLSPEDGIELWKRKLKENKYRLAYVADGLVWVADGKDVTGLDPETGDEKRKVRSPGSLDTCAPHFATHGLLIDPRHSSAVDLRTGVREKFYFARGGCGVGYVAANGLYYTVPTACACYRDALRGFLSLTAVKRKSGGGEISRLERGPARVDAPDRTDEEWPTYRHDPRRSARSPRTVPDGLRELWKTPIRKAGGARADEEWELRVGAPVTAPVAAGDKVFLAVPNAHRVVALDAGTGRPSWEFTAGGRVDAPPTIAAGLCLFGAHDGWVYAVSAADGRLAWRFRAAPLDQKIVAFGQLESVWPALGSVLVHDGVAYAAAGRSPEADGGIHVHALKPQTGRVLWSRVITEGDKRGLGDLLVGGDDALLLAGHRLDWKTGEILDEKKREKALRGGFAGLMEASWTRLPIGLRKDLQTWTRGETTGQLLAWSPDRVFGYDTHSSGRSIRKKDDDILFADGKNDWTAKVRSPMQVEAMILTGDLMWVAGAVDRRQRATRGGFLLSVDPEEGKLNDPIGLASPPVYNGLAAAYGRLYVTTEDGHLVCFGR